MTMPFTAATASTVAALTWDRAMTALSGEVQRLLDAVVRGDRTATQNATVAVNASYQAAVKAAKAYSEGGLKPTEAMQSRWVTVLTAMDNAMRSARTVVGDAQFLPPVVVTGELSGFRIPGTSIIVPWIAIAGVAAVVIAGIYFSKRRR